MGVSPMSSPKKRVVDKENDLNMEDENIQHKITSFC